MSAVAFMGDIVALTKPKISLMALLVAMAGVLHAQEQPLLLAYPVILFLIGIALLVSGSGALNMYLERELDGRMKRTKERPLPAGRLKAFWAVLVGSACAFLATILLLKASNLTTAIAGLLSLVLYVWCYTPLKLKSWTALFLGSVPGAMPVILGYLSWSGVFDAKALALFMWAFLWQIPHFLAISIFREQEYTNAGFPVMSAIFGIEPTKRVLLFSSYLLVLATFGLYGTGAINSSHLVLALSLGAWFLWVCHRGYFSEPVHFWAKRAFKASLVYQSLLFVLLIVAAVV